MEIVLKNLFYNRDLCNINLTIKSNKIIGIYSNMILCNIILGNLSPTAGNIFKNSILIDKHNVLKFKNKESIIDYNNIVFYTTRVKDELEFYFSKNKIRKKNYSEMEMNILDNVGLDNTYLRRNLNNLSSSEKYMLFVSLKLFLNSDIICFNGVPTYLDKKNRNRIINLLKIEKEKNKIVLFNTSDIDLLYGITDEVILATDKLIDYDDTYDVFTNEKMLIENDIEMPTLIKITYLAKKEKNIKLFYHTDVRDIIKDIYKHV